VVPWWSSQFLAPSADDFPEVADGVFMCSGNNARPGRIRQAGHSGKLGVLFA
jgi:hypothetical protein